MNLDTVSEMHAKQAALGLLSQQLGIIGKAAKNRPLRLEELGVVILPTLDQERLGAHRGR